jgi:hypothetical protein
MRMEVVPESGYESSIRRGLKQPGNEVIIVLQRLEPELRNEPNFIGGVSA